MLHFFKKKSIPAQKELAVKAVIDFVGVHRVRVGPYGWLYGLFIFLML